VSEIERQLADTMQVLHDTFRYASPISVIISDPAGIGKTQLLKRSTSSQLKGGT
jgi:hypothetical protein